MSQQSLSESVKLESIWGKFSSHSAAKATQKKLEETGIAPEKITIETETFEPRLKLQETQTFDNLKFGAITGGVLGALIGLFISLIVTGFFNVGFAAFSHFQTIHYLAPLMGAIVGASGMSLIAGISGKTTPKPNTRPKVRPLDKNHLVIVKGTDEEIDLAQNIFRQQEGFINDQNQ